MTRTAFFRRALPPLILAATACLAPRAQAQAAQQPLPPTGDTPEARLWHDVQAVTAPPPASQPYEAWLANAEPRRRLALRTIENYLTQFPGGVHRDEVIQLQLQTMFELATLRAEPPRQLIARVAELLRAPPNAVVAGEAAYWQLVCERYTESPAASPATAPADPANEPLDAYRAYIDRYPAARHIPRLATLVFEDAEQRRDRTTMQAMVAHLRAYFADQPATAALEARLRRLDALGRVQHFTFTLIDGQPFNTAQLPRQPLLIVVWAAFDDASCQALPRVERVRQTHPGLQVIGVSLDPQPEDTKAAAARLNIPWPQANDGQGWGGPFIRSWGVRTLPEIFILGADNRLIGIGGPAEWESLAQRALAEPPRPW